MSDSKINRRKTFLGLSTELKFSKGTKYFLTIVVLLVLFFLRMVPEDRTFHDDLYQAAEQAGNVLVSYGICDAINKKCGGTVYFVNASKGGGYVVIYGVSQQEILDKFVAPFIKKFIELDKMTKLVITSVVPTKEESMNNRLSKDKINFQIEMRRD